jgi:hypothetical protein
MRKQTVPALFALALFVFFNSAPVNAEDEVDTHAVASHATTGAFGNLSGSTSDSNRADSSPTSNQRIPGLQYAGFGGLAEIHGPTGRNGLPITSTGSFVENAGGFAELIFGGEGSNGIPVYEGFEPIHRIERGIQGVSAEGLTTGHGSLLPSASGGDEFVKPEAFTQAGSSSGGNTWGKSDLTGSDPGTQPPAESGF